MVAKKREDRYPDWGWAPGKGRDVSMVEPKREARRTILLGSGCKREGRVHGGTGKGGTVAGLGAGAGKREGRIYGGT